MTRVLRVCLSWGWLPRRYLQDNAIESIGLGTLEGLANLQDLYVAEALPMLALHTTYGGSDMLLQSPFVACMVQGGGVRMPACCWRTHATASPYRHALASC
jgi:hypothetical protein